MKRQWLKTGSFAILDQAWLSLVNLLISLAFIRYGEKSEYGLYVLLLTPISLIQGVQNALFLSPFASIYPQRHEAGRLSLMQFIVWGQVTFALLAAMLGLIGLLLFSLFSTAAIDVFVILAFFTGILGVLAREAARSFQYVRGYAGRAFLGDLVYGVLIVSLIYIVLRWSQMSAAIMLLITGVAGVFPFFRSIALSSHPERSIPAFERAEFWRYGRWALIGVALTWVNLNLYPFFAAGWFGLDSVADINASRLFMMPLMLALPAWSNLLKPKFSKWFIENRFHQMRQVSISSVVIGFLAVLSYSILIVAIYSWIEIALGKAYAGLLPMVLGWSIVYIFTTLRTILTANLMVHESGFKVLSSISFMSTLVLLPALAVSSQFSPLWLIGALAIVELFQLLMVALRTFPYWKGVVNG